MQVIITSCEWWDMKYLAAFRVLRFRCGEELRMYLPWGSKPVDFAGGHAMRKWRVKRYKLPVTKLNTWGCDVWPGDANNTVVHIWKLGFSGGLVGKESAYNAGDLGSIPGEWNGNLLQFVSGESLQQRSLMGYNPWGHDLVTKSPPPREQILKVLFTR